MPAVRQFFLNDRTTLTTSLACAFRVYCYKLPSSFFRFLRQYISKLTPCNICNAFIELIAKKFGLITHHAFNIKFFNTDSTIFINNFSGFLMNKVMPFIGNPLVDTSNNLFSFFSFRGAFSLFGQFPLSFCKSLLAGLKKTRIFYFALIRKSSKIFQTNIYTNGIVGFWQRVIIIFNRKTGVPFVGSPADSECLYCAFDASMFNNFDRAYLRQLESIVNKSESALRKGEAIIAIETLKSWVARFFSYLNPAKERAEGKINSHSNILQALRVSVVEFGIFFFPSGQKIAGVVARYGFFAFFPCLLSYFKGFVVCPPASIKKKLEGFLLFSSRIQSIFESLTHKLFLIHSYVKVNHYFKKGGGQGNRLIHLAEDLSGVT